MDGSGWSWLANSLRKRQNRLPHIRTISIWKRSKNSERQGTVCNAILNRFVKEKKQRIRMKIEITVDRKRKRNGLLCAKLDSCEEDRESEVVGEGKGERLDGSRTWRRRARNIASRKNTSEISACGAAIVERRTESIIASENVSINSATRPVYACMKITKLLITTAIN